METRRRVLSDGFEHPQQEYRDRDVQPRKKNTNLYLIDDIAIRPQPISRPVVSFTSRLTDLANDYDQTGDLHIADAETRIVLTFDQIQEFFSSTPISLEETWGEMTSRLLEGYAKNADAIAADAVVSSEPTNTAIAARREGANRKQR